MRCESLNAFISYMQCNFTIDLLLFYCIISSYETICFTHQIKIKNAMQSTVYFSEIYIYHIESVTFHASDNLIVMHLNVYGFGHIKIKQYIGRRHIFSRMCIPLYAC